MNMEKSLLIVSILFFLGIAGYFATKSALIEREYDVSKMYVSRTLLLKGKGAAEPYRLKSQANPFEERTAQGVIEVEMDLPDMPVLRMEKPPVIWRKDK